MTWTLTNSELSQQELLTLESLFSLGNGYLGVRGNFEEGYGPEMTSIRGTYVNAFHDIIDISYGEKLYGFPETQQKLVNIIDAQTVELRFGEDGERFSLFDGEILSYNRVLHLDRGYSEREIHWRSPQGKEVKLHFRRLVSFVTRELFALDIKIEPINFNGKVVITSSVNGEVTNFIDDNDPRVGSGHAKRLTVEETGHEMDYLFVRNKTYTSELEVACVSRCHVTGEHHLTVKRKDEAVESEVTLTLDKPVHFTKWNVFTDTLRHNSDLIRKGFAIQNNISMLTFDDILVQQKNFLDEFWGNADVVIDGEANLQEGIRFNLFQLLQAAGRDQFSNIAAKGLSGEGYEGHYFWDTEIYMFPVFLMTRPELARQLLIYRYSILEHAKVRAREMGHKQGALFPWRTISGTECSAFFPAGTAQYHISADIAYSYVQYYLATEDLAFLEKYGAEVLAETARLWIDIGHYHDGSFKIDDVTGPDEYTAIVNNNYYTNVMAKYNLQWAAQIFELLTEAESKNVNQLRKRLAVTDAEIAAWKKAAAAMHLPYDEGLGINPQDDSFLQKAVWDFENTPAEHYPLLLHYHPLTLYRYQVCKQADTVLAHFLLEDEQSESVIKRSFDYYEKITTHDSSLSSCVFSIMAAKVGYTEKAYDYFIETARLDLDNTHGNTKDGLHMANMGGTWLAIVYGFGGVRIKKSGLSLAPIMPSKWQHYRFKLQYRGRTVAVDVHEHELKLQVTEGASLELQIYGELVTLPAGEAVVFSMK